MPSWTCLRTPSAIGGPVRGGLWHQDTQLATKTKLFSSSPIAFGAEPNTQASEIDLGLPGVLPVLNKEAISHALKFGCAINAEISEKVIFARKNYFYPDLPKGYQISQLDDPIVGKGSVEI